MIHVLITVKESVRFPGKNRLLWGYTQAWLAQEMQGILEDVRVWVVGEVGPFRDLIPARWHMLSFHDGDHGRVQALAEAEILKLCADEEADGVEPVFVLCQLTNPLRRRGLLGDAVASARAAGAAVSYSLAPCLEWREAAVRLEPASDDESRLAGRAFCEVAHGLPGCVAVLDGCIFAWTRGRCEDSRRFGGGATRVFNLQGALCDIDRRLDLPGGLELEWARLMVGA